MKQKLKLKAIDDFIYSENLNNDQDTCIDQRSIQPKIKASDRYMENDYPYTNRCAPWRYVKIFKNTTIRP